MSIRHTIVPTYHTQVELAAFPFASEAALKIGTTRLELSLGNDTGALWRETEAQLLGESPALSLDELGAMRDQAWFDSKQSGTITLVELLRSISEKYLSADGPLARPKQPYPTTDGSNDILVARKIWRWLSFALPPDLLLAGLPAPCPLGGVDAVGPGIAAQLLQEGFSETHVHKGAAMPFGVLWASGLHAIAASQTKASALKSAGGACREGQDLAPWLLRTAIARYLLGRYLASYQSDSEDTLEKWLGGFRGELAKRRGRVVVTAVLDQAIEDLCAGQLTHAPQGPTFANLQNLYADISSVRTACLGSSQDPIRPCRDWEQDSYLLDPLHAVVPLVGKWSSPELWFLSTGLKYLEAQERPKSGSQDPLFERLFWQCVRVRCLIYRHVVQRPMTPGLQWFVRVYERLKPLRKGLGALPGPGRTATALNISGMGQGLRSIELRICPEASVQENLDGPRNDEKLYGRSTDTFPFTRRNDLSRDKDLNRTSPHASTPIQDPSLPKLGYIFHFVRNRGDLQDGKLPAHWAGCVGDPSYDPRRPKKGNPSGYRYARFYGERRREALVLARTLTSFPVMLEVMRGVDVCTDEVGVPTWVLAPLVRYVCDASKAASIALGDGSGHAAGPFRRAVHTGEDFVHLMSGMRRMHQSIKYLGLGEGDRIGHGLALGLDPERWAKDIGRIAMPKEERLFDLVWAWSCMTDGRVSSSTAVAVEHEIRSLARAIFGDGRSQRLEPADIAYLVSDLHHEDKLRAAGFPSGHRRRDKDADHDRPKDADQSQNMDADRRRKLLLHYLTDNQVYQQGMKTIWVAPAHEGELLLDLQNEMRKEVAQKDITVEVNPTSNLLIGHVPDLRHHPLWRLSPGPHKPHPDMPPLSICIGSDDPITFATSLPQEYQLLHDALVEDGATSAQALEWVDRTRKVGLQRSFTMERSERDLMERIPVSTKDLTLPP